MVYVKNLSAEMNVETRLLSAHVKQKPDMMTHNKGKPQDFIIMKNVFYWPTKREEREPHMHQENETKDRFTQ